MWKGKVLKKRKKNKKKQKKRASHGDWSHWKLEDLHPYLEKTYLDKNTTAAWHGYAATQRELWRTDLYCLSHSCMDSKTSFGVLLG